MQNDLTNDIDVSGENTAAKTEYTDLPEDDAQIKIELPGERVPTDSTIGAHDKPEAGGDPSSSPEIEEPDGDQKDTSDNGESKETDDDSGEKSQDDDIPSTDSEPSENKKTEQDNPDTDTPESGSIDDNYQKDSTDGNGNEPNTGATDGSDDSLPLPANGISEEDEDTDEADSSDGGDFTHPLARGDSAQPEGEDGGDYVQISLFDDEELKAPDESENEDEDEDDEPRKYDPDHPRFIDSIFDFVELFIFSLVAVLLATTFLFRHTVVDGSSMEQTLYHGEHLIISNLFYTPQRGDIIVCVDYSTIHKKPIVKRIIGLPGDEIKVYPSGAVYVNGEKLEEDYVYNDFVVPQEYVEVTVEDGRLFVMGDHRNVSSDSRSIGTIDIDSVLGKVVFRFYPFDKFGAVE